MFFAIKHLCVTLYLLSVTPCKFYCYTEGHRGPIENHRENSTKNLVLFYNFDRSKSLNLRCKKEGDYPAG
jgi:hypothetical protein